MDKQQEFKNITTEMVELYEKKNHDYGDAFGQTFAELGIISAVTRISDKTNRLKSLATKAQRVDDERIEDTLMDLANYAVMTLIELKSEVHQEKFPKSMVENNRQNQQLKITERTNLREINMNLQEENKALKERIAELEGREKEEQEFPQDGDNYWYINQLGIIMHDKWSGFVSEGYMTEIGNVFQTEQQAQFAAEKLKVEVELQKFSRPFKCGEINRYIFLDTDSGCLNLAGLSYSQYQGTIYFESEDEAYQAIESVGEDRIIKYLFGMEDQQ